MAKIRTVIHKVNGKHVEFQVHYAAKYKRFEIRLPEEMEAYVDSSNGTASTPTAGSEEELETRLRDFIARYETHKMVQRKIIAYRIERSSKNIEDPNDCYGWNRNSVRGAASIRFEYHVLFERTVDGRTSFMQEEEQEYDDKGNRYEEPRMILRHSMLDQDEYHVIDWSPKAEEFMANFYGAMEALMLKIDRFLGTPEAAIAAMQKGIQLLAPPTKTRPRRSDASLPPEFDSSEDDA